MKKTSKILSILLALLTLLSVTVVPVSADVAPYTEMTIIPDKSNLQVGQYVGVYVVIPENSNLASVTIDLKYDPSVFEIDGGGTYGLFTDADGDANEVMNLDYADDTVRFVGIDDDSVTAGGTIFDVVFRAVSETSRSEFSISVEEAFDSEYTDFYVHTNTASVAVSACPSLTVTADKSNVNIGDYVTVDVLLSENSNLSALTVDLHYDSYYLKPVSMTRNGLFTNVDLGVEESNMNYADGVARFTAANRSVVTQGGSLFTVVFKVINSGTTQIFTSVEEASDYYYGYTYVETNDLYLNNEVYFYEPSRTTIRYKDGIKLRYDTSAPLPEGWYVVFAGADNDNFDIDYNEEDDSYTITSVDNGYTTFYVNLIDNNDNIVSSDAITMRSKAGFFDKIGGFFRSLFGTTTIYEY